MDEYRKVSKAIDKLVGILNDKKLRPSHGKENGKFIIIVRSKTQPEVVIPETVDDYKVKLIVTGV